MGSKKETLQVVKFKSGEIESLHLNFSLDKKVSNLLIKDSKEQKRTIHLHCAYIIENYYRNKLDCIKS